MAVSPSPHPDTHRPYTWVGAWPVNEMPPALVAACLAPAPGTAPSPMPSGGHLTAGTRPSGGGGISSPSALLSAHLAAVERAPEGKRRTTLYGAARGVARIVLSGALAYPRAWDVLYTAGRAAGQSDRETRTAILGGFTAEGLSQ